MSSATTTVNPLAVAFATAIAAALAPFKTAATNVVADPTLANVTSQTTSILATSLPTLEQEGIAAGGNLVLTLIADIEAKLASIGTTPAATVATPVPEAGSANPAA